MSKKRILEIVAATLMVVSFAMSPVIVSAATAKQDILNGVETVDPGGGQSVDSTIGTVIGILSMIIGIISVIMILLGSYKYITSAGDAGKVASAKSTIIYALVGVSLVVLSQVILRFVIAKSLNP